MQCLPIAPDPMMMSPTSFTCIKGIMVVIYKPHDAIREG